MKYIGCQVPMTRQKMGKEVEVYSCRSFPQLSLRVGSLSQYRAMSAGAHSLPPLWMGVLLPGCRRYREVNCDLRVDWLRPLKAPCHASLPRPG